MNNLLKTTLTALALVGAIILGSQLAPGSVPTVPPARADGLGGVIGEANFAPLLDGTRRYTTSLSYSNPVDLKGFGSVQIMLNAVVTGSQTITVTPQFSLQPVACSAVTQWFTATTYLYYQPYSIATSSTTLTETIGAWQATPIIDLFTVTGSRTVGREISIQGQCLRVQLQFSNSGQAYTPTIVVRALDRN
jgi:hypothetical protein